MSNFIYLEMICVYVICQLGGLTCDSLLFFFLARMPGNVTFVVLNLEEVSVSKFGLLCHFC